MRRAWCWILAPLLLAACREKAPPRAIPVRVDGVLELSLCSFNVRYEGDRDRGWRAWPNRLGRVVRTVRELDPDVMGVQEAQHGQVADLWASLPDYAFHGVGRDDGRRAGEYAGIFWKRERFEADATDRGTFWLSDRPAEAGSKSWGNEHVRCVSWIRLVDLPTGRGFYVFNTHWDHRNQPSRERAALLMAERIDGRRHPDEEVVLLGDFNATRGNPAVAYLTGGRVELAGRIREPWRPGLTDVYTRLVPDEENRRTLHFWEGMDGSRLNHLKVDHILVSPGAKLESAGIFRAPTREAQPSDHFPVWARVAWPEPEPADG